MKYTVLLAILAVTAATAFGASGAGGRRGRPAGNAAARADAGKDGAQAPAAQPLPPVRTEADVDARLEQMRALCQGRDRNELIAQFGSEDIAAWLKVFKDRRAGTGKVVDALNLRGTGFYIEKDYPRAEADFKAALALSPNNGYVWNSLGDVYRSMREREKALEAYNKAYESDRAEHTAKTYGWMPISATLEAATILTSETKYDEALKTLDRYDDNDIRAMGAAWGCRLLRAKGQIYAATGLEEEALSKYKAALELEGKQGR